MCGRYAFANPDTQALKDRFQVNTVPPEMKPRYNIAPTQRAPVILNDAPEAVQLVRWGLIPHWAKDPTIGYRMINARVETIAEKPAFRRPFRRQRCLILTDGFYEWQRAGKRKVPYRITLGQGELFALAGIWDRWTEPAKQSPLTTFAIITTAAGRLMAPIHDRMPVILPEAQERAWLDPELAEDEALALLKPAEPKGMRAYAISTLVNSPQNDIPEVLKPAQPED